MIFSVALQLELLYRFDHKAEHICTLSYTFILIQKGII